MKKLITGKDADESSLSHTKWNCMYHIVFIPKYRRKSIYGKLRRDIGTYLRRLCDYSSYFFTFLTSNPIKTIKTVNSSKLELRSISLFVFDIKYITIKPRILPIFNMISLNVKNSH